MVPGEGTHVVVAVHVALGADGRVTYVAAVRFADQTLVVLRWGVDVQVVYRVTLTVEVGGILVDGRPIERARVLGRSADFGAVNRAAVRVAQKVDVVAKLHRHVGVVLGAAGGYGLARRRDARLVGEPRQALGGGYGERVSQRRGLDLGRGAAGAIGRRRRVERFNPCAHLCPVGRLLHGGCRRGAVLLEAFAVNRNEHRIAVVLRVARAIVGLGHAPYGHVREVSHGGFFVVATIVGHKRNAAQLVGRAPAFEDIGRDSFHLAGGVVAATTAIKSSAEGGGAAWRGGNWVEETVGAVIIGGHNGSRFGSANRTRIIATCSVARHRSCDAAGIAVGGGGRDGAGVVAVRHVVAHIAYDSTNICCTTDVARVGAAEEESVIGAAKDAADIHATTRDLACVRAVFDEGITRIRDNSAYSVSAVHVAFCTNRRVPHEARLHGAEQTLIVRCVIVRRGVDVQVVYRVA